MKTSKPIATVHYCEPFDLMLKLDELILKNVLIFYAFITHQPEEDENKMHIHLYMVPNGTIDTDQLRNEIEFLDPKNIKPIRCLPINKSKFQDWYLYGLHDKGYLATKGQSRKYQYRHEDFQTSDDDYFLEMTHQIDYSKSRIQDTFNKMVKAGMTFSEIIATGLIPPGVVWGYQQMFKAMVNVSTFRNGFKGHEDEREEEQ